MPEFSALAQRFPQLRVERVLMRTAAGDPAGCCAGTACGQGVNPSSACLKRFPVRCVDGKMRVGIEAVANEPAALSACPGSVTS